ncbi:N-acetyltransferase [Candidatus Bathyarchaeota archaeon]|nr:N-acetyltransferase [Candidatus Bathyarchaeota archaeon]
MIFLSSKARVKGRLEGENIILGPTVIGENSLIGKNVIVGYPARKSFKSFQFPESFSIEKYDLISKGAKIGRNCVVRSGTIIYETVSIGDGVETGHNVLIRDGSLVGEKTLIGSSTQLDGTVKVGKNVNIQSNAYLPHLTVIGNGVFIAPNVCFTNDPYPTSKRLTGALVGKNAIIGANSSIMAGVRIGKNAVVGAGAVVTKNVPANTIVIGAPARPYMTRKEYEEKRLRWEKAR